MDGFAVAKTIRTAEQSDTERLVRQAKADPANFTSLYRRYVTGVYRYIYARVRNHDEAEDLTAQVFLDALKGLDRFDGSRNFTAWLFTIARNKVVDSRRKGRALLPLDAILEAPADDDDPHHANDDAEMFDRLRALLRELPPDKQELIQLRFAGGLSFAEIGKVVGKSEAAVKMAVRRVLHQLQEKMEAHHG